MDQIMDNMMRSMMMPFGDMGMGFDPFAPMNRMMNILDGVHGQNPHQQMMMIHQSQQPGAVNFGAMQLPGLFTGGMVPGGVVHSSFTTTSYTTDEHGRRQVYQESHASTEGPGGVKETKSSVRDSRSGRQEMAIGHHIKDKAHIKKKSKNIYTGDGEQAEDFINLDDQEVDRFEQEWQQKTSSCYSGSNMNQNNPMMLGNHRPRSQLALTSSAQEDRTSDFPSHCQNGGYVPQPKPSSSGHRVKSRHHKTSRTSPDLSPMHNSSTGGPERKISKKIKEIKNKIIKKAQSGQ